LCFKSLQDYVYYYLMTEQLEQQFESKIDELNNLGFDPTVKSNVEEFVRIINIGFEQFFNISKLFKDYKQEDIESPTLDNLTNYFDEDIKYYGTCYNPEKIYLPPSLFCIKLKSLNNEIYKMIFGIGRFEKLLNTIEKIFNRSMYYYSKQFITTCMPYLTYNMYALSNSEFMTQLES